MRNLLVYAYHEAVEECRQQMRNFVGNGRKRCGLIYDTVGCVRFSHLTYSQPWRKYLFAGLRAQMFLRIYPVLGLPVGLHIGNLVFFFIELIKKQYHIHILMCRKCVTFI